MRPQKYYVVFQDGQAAHIVEGRKAALLLSPSISPTATRLEAEEYAAWFNYEHPRWFDPSSTKG